MGKRGKPGKVKPKYTYRAIFRPNPLTDLSEFHTEPQSDGRGLGYTQAWHRVNTEYSPHCVVNEFVCARIGTILGLPIPPFALTQDADGMAYFSSLDFNFQRAKLPPILPEECYRSLPEVCAGVLVFDILIANEDRHDGNLACDKVKKPRFLHVYDHDQALFAGAGRLKGIERLDKLRNHLGITGPDIGGNRHVFLDVIDKPELLDPWRKRISELPEWVLEDTCAHARAVLGLDAKHADAAKGFLIHRRDQLDAIIKANRSEFKSISRWPKGLFT